VNLDSIITTFAKYEVEKFTSLNDFGLWWLKSFCLKSLLGTLVVESRLDVAMVEKDKK